MPSKKRPPIAELDMRVTRIRVHQANDQMPDVDLYWCACGVWIVAIRGTADVPCNCGQKPTYLETVVKRPNDVTPAQIRAALEELVALKDLKDTEGKTADYERRQPLAWHAAREALA